MPAIDSIKRLFEKRSRLCTIVDEGAAEAYIYYVRQTHPSHRFRPFGSQTLHNPRQKALGCADSRRRTWTYHSLITEY